MGKLSTFARWFTGGNRYDGAQTLGHLGTPYFRYDASHHLHRAIDRLKLTKKLGMLLLAAWLVATGIFVYLVR